MVAIQQQDKIAFSTGRLFSQPTAGGARLFYGDLTDASVDIKIDLKEAFGEGGYPIAVADGHRSIDVSAKHYTLRLDALSNDLGASTSTTSQTAFSVDEQSIVPGTPYQYTLANSAAYVANSAVLQVFVGANQAPTIYAFVTNGSEVAGQSASITGGVLKFAAGDTALTFKVTYQYTNALGKSLTLANTYQGSGLPMQMVLMKRDLSPIDGTIGQLILTLNAVRSGGIKMDWKEGDFTVYDRTFKAYANLIGVVGVLQFVNTSTNNTP